MDLVQKAWPKTADHAKWFQKQVVEPMGLTRVKHASFGEFVGKRGDFAFALRSWEDHSKIWFAGRNRVVFTTEPYGLSGSQLAELIAAVNRHGLKLSIDARSPHYIGATVMVIISRMVEA